MSSNNPIYKQKEVDKQPKMIAYYIHEGWLKYHQGDFFEYRKTEHKHFMLMTAAMKHYDITKDNLVCAALEEKIFIYYMMMGVFYPLQEGSLSELRYYGVAEAPWDSGSKKREPKKLLDENNLTVNIDELEQALCFVDNGSAPPLLTLAYNCWQALFTGDVRAVNKTAGRMIDDWFVENLGIYKKNKLTDEQLECLRTLIIPKKYRRKQIKDDYYNLPRVNKDGHEFYSEELERAIKIWRRLVRKKSWDYNKNDLNNHISYLTVKEGSFHNRLKKVLARWEK